MLAQEMAVQLTNVMGEHFADAMELLNNERDRLPVPAPAPDAQG